MTSVSVSDLRRVILDFPTFARVNLRIKTKKRQLIPLVLNGEQEIVWSVVREQMERDEPVRVAILKPRQIGMSTLCQALTFWNIVTHYNTHAIAIAHDAESTQRIFEMSKLFFDCMPKKPLRRYHTRSEISFENDDEVARPDHPGLRSRIEIRTAGKMGAGRSVTTHVLHCSEVAQWPFPEDLVSGLFPAVPYEPETMIFMESTAHGAGDWWHEFWQQCKDADSQFEPVFIPWYTVREYELAPRLAARWMEARAIDTEEKRLRRLFHLSDGRLAWRRMRIKELKGDEDLFRQEYPATEEEAWIVAGMPVFDAHRLLAALERCRRPQARGYLTGNLTFREDPKAPIRVWEFPKPGARYVIGADVAQGLPGGDYSCMQVLTADDDQVAVWHGHIDPIAFAHEVEKVARWYNEALVNIEIQNHGFSTLAELRQRYYNIFRWRYMDRFYDRLTDKIGWECVVPSALMLTRDLRWVRADTLRVGDELIGCTESANGRGDRHRFGEQRIVRIEQFDAPLVRIDLANGARTTVSATHPFLAFRKSLGVFRWIEAVELRPGDAVKFIAPWEPVRTYEAGRLSAFLDGEGHLSQGHPAGLHLQISQAIGPLAAEMVDLWHVLGFPALFKWVRHKKRPQEQPIAVSGLLRMPDVLRALGTLRPSRLLRRFVSQIDLRRLTVSSLDTVPVTSVQRAGSGLVIGVETTPDHTLIADGIIGHNTNMKTKPLLIAHASHLIREGDCRIRERELVQEMMRFIETPTGGEAAAGCKDDRVMAWMIALYTNHLERPKGDGGTVSMLPYEQAEEHMPDEVLKDPDAYLRYDLGQHVHKDDDEELDWRQL